MKTLSPKLVHRAIQIIRQGGILVYPTDTLYGIGGDGTKKKVVDRIYRTKGRDRGKPLSVIMADMAMVKKYCFVMKSQKNILRKYLPGPYTFILRLRKKLPATKTKKIGIRIPAYAPIVRICRRAGVPIITTSANVSGKRDAREVQQVDRRIRKAADLVLDGGKTKYRKGSTVVDLVERRIVRPGAGRFRLEK